MQDCGRIKVLPRGCLQLLRFLELEGQTGWFRDLHFEDDHHSFHLHVEIDTAPGKIDPGKQMQ